MSCNIGCASLSLYLYSSLVTLESLALCGSMCMDKLQCNVAEVPGMAPRCSVSTAVHSTQKHNVWHRLT